MANFNANFIASYTTTDKAIIFKDKNDVKIAGVNLHKFSTFSQEKKILTVFCADNVQLNFEFDSETVARQAASNFKVALADLMPNISVGFTAPPPSVAVVPETVASFQNLISTNSLVPNTIYEIPDVSNSFGISTISSPVFRIVPLQSNQVVFQDAYETSTGSKLTLDFNTNTCTRIETVTSPIISLVGNAANLTLTGTNDRIVARESSIIGNNIQNITIHDSTVDISNCTNVKIENCNGLKLANVSDSEFIGVTGDYSAYTIQGTRITPGLTGKNGSLTQTNFTSTYNAFIDKQEIHLPDTLSSNIDILLGNPFIANKAEFWVKVDDNFPAGRIVTVRDYLTNNIISRITSEQKGTKIGYVWEPPGSPESGEFREIISTKISTKSPLTIVSDGQTTFANALQFEPKYPQNTILFINGVAYKYSTHYTISGTTIVLNGTNLGFTVKAGRDDAYIQFIN